MNLSITKRLTLTSAFLTLLLFIPIGLGLYWSLVSNIKEEASRKAQFNSEKLAFNALYQWNDDLLLEYKGCEDPLQLLSFQDRHWAVVRGDGKILNAGRGFFSDVSNFVPDEKSSLYRFKQEEYRLASNSLYQAPLDGFNNLIPDIQIEILARSPDSDYLRTKRETNKKASHIEVWMLEPDHILKYEFSSEGILEEIDLKFYPTELPHDLLEKLRSDEELASIKIVDWKAYQGQLCAIVEACFKNGSKGTFGVNRLGERFIVDSQYAILKDDPQYKLWMSTAHDVKTENLQVADLRWSLWVGLPLLWAAVVIVGWWMTRRALKPVQKIVTSAQEIEIHHLDRRLPVGSSEDELSEISQTINSMLDRIQEGYQRESQFTGDASHELRSPIAKMIACIDLGLSQNRDEVEYRQILKDCRKYAKGMQELVEALLCLARLDSHLVDIHSKEFDLMDLVTETICMLPADQAKRIRLELNYREQLLMVTAAGELIQVMLRNLIQNALRYSPSRSEVKVKLNATDEACEVEVIDEGEGIPEEQIERVFSRFYRLDASRSRDTGGFGLGLAIVNEIAVAHGIRVRLQNLPEGFSVSFTLPFKKSLRSESPHTEFRTTQSKGIS